MRDEFWLSDGAWASLFDKLRVRPSWFRSRGGCFGGVGSLPSFARRSGLREGGSNHEGRTIQPETVQAAIQRNSNRSGRPAGGQTPLIVTLPPSNTR